MKIRKALSLLALAFAMVFSATGLAAAGAMRVATDATFPPLEFVQNGKRTGFDIELIEAIAKTLGRPVQWVDIDFKGLIPGLIANRFDVAASGIYMTDERRKVVDFTDSYYSGGLVAIVRRDTKAINQPADLAGKKVSVQVGTKSVAYLKDTYPTVQRVEVEKNQEMFDLLLIGRVDAVVTGRPAAAEFAKAQPSVRVLDKALTTELYGFALRKGDPLTGQMNQALQKLRANGSYNALVTRWFGAGK
ncbi:MAG: transporter substrate-binding domain-containing protein [Holophaga sp.]|nr:transporter substrate-binding domain-containing protein [Holophaga sp.]